MKLKTDNLVGFILCHGLASLAFFPWFFSWTGVVALAVGLHVFGILGINLGSHRLITHRGFSGPLWLAHTFAIRSAACQEARCLGMARKRRGQRNRGYAG